MNSDELELLRRILRSQNELTGVLSEVIALLEVEKGDEDSPTFRTMAEKQADETDDFDRL